ncbi:olfactory receptor family 6 subfamily K member 2 [Canis lupus familiaris]|uniref:Olfactory receptor family 6 subfamily K member 2 n=1 Tax=Canis lupus familiaris TaxID=9615 RepID=A0A8C0PHK4_CANLF|eukprot:XP_013966644.1 olfactory receptor 6K2 [Canis lupus familiaris]
MESPNQSTTQEFIFSAFPCSWGSSVSCFVPLLFIYTFIVFGNLVIITVVQLNAHLHTPMYFFISALSFLEIWYTTATIPKMLASLLSERKSISLNGCLLQMYFFHSTGISEVCLLTAMAFDHYLAICSPLHYPTTMTPRLCAQLTLSCCVCGFITPLPEIAWISTLPFCGSNHLEHIFCDFLPMLRLACTDTQAIVMIQVVDIVHAVEIITAIMLIFMSYVGIVAVILHIRSAEGRRKAFSTCVSHLTVFLLFFGNVALMYLRFSATYSLFWDTVIALAFAVLSPFFNPIIYSLRNKEIKEAIKKHWGQAKIFFYKTKDLK